MNNVSNILIAKKDIYLSRESVNLGEYIHSFELILFELKGWLCCCYTSERLEFFFCVNICFMSCFTLGCRQIILSVEAPSNCDIIGLPFSTFKFKVQTVM